MKKRIWIVLSVVLLLGAAWAINAFDNYAQMDRELPVGVTLQTVFREDGSAELICGEESLTFSKGAFPEESTSLGEAQIEVLSPGAVRAIFGATSILFLEEGAEVTDITADVVWGHVTQRFGANFAVFPEEPPEQLRQALEEQGMTVLSPSPESTVNIQSDGKEVLLFWTSHASFPAMSAAK